MSFFIMVIFWVTEIVQAAQILRDHSTERSPGSPVSESSTNSSQSHRMQHEVYIVPRQFLKKILTLWYF